MDTPALIAYQQPDNTFTTYFAPTGADHYILKPALEAFLSETDSSNGLPAFDTDRVTELETEFADQSDIPLSNPGGVNSDPVTEAMSLSNLSDAIKFYDIKTVYVVQPTGVEVYLPLYVSMFVLQSLSRLLTIEVYDKSDIESADSPNEFEPEAVFNHFDFTVDGIENLPGEYSEFFSYYHADFLAGADRAVSNDNPHKFIDFGSHVFVVHPNTDTVPVDSDGVFLHVPWDAETGPKYQWSALEEYNHPLNIAGGIRFDESKRFLSQNPSTDFDTLTKAVATAQLRFFIRLYKEYGDDLLTELTPSQYQSQLKQARDAVRSSD